MPDFYAHLIFGGKVLSSLPGELRERITSQLESYICGQYGPDPMFFLGRRSRAIAQRVHRGPVKLPIANLSGAVAKSVPESDGYAAGFLCHFVLDSVCHPYVLSQMGRSALSHAAIEGEFDRFLMAQDGILATRTMPMPPMSKNTYVYAAGAIPYGISALTYNHALASYWIASQAMTAAGGTPLSKLVDLAGRLPGLYSLRGSVSGYAPRPEAFESNRALALLLESAVEDCSELIEGFFAAADEGEIFYTPRLELNFYGKLTDVYTKVKK
ncbi:MAG: zinc dependent phospholipase C family protein [Oscillospiraceae bacterium]|nr:zinc dependent phospholipase C family protein [Oscillospiraceae bacterium]